MTTFISKTYNTGIKAKKGDLLEISFVDVSKYIDPKTGKVWFNLWAPHVIKKLEDGKTTSIKTLENLVEQTTGRVASKSLPKHAKSFGEGQTTLKFLGTLGEDVKPAGNHQKDSSILLTKNGKKLMIDCGKTIRQDLLNIKPDWLLLTHGHHDHIDGLKDGYSGAVYLSRITGKDVKGMKLEKLHFFVPGKWFKLGDFEILPFKVYHSILHPSVGFKIKTDDKTIIYCSDVCWIPIKEKVLKDVDVYIGDGSCSERDLIRKHKKTGRIFGHVSLKTQIKWCQKAGIEKIYFTHFGDELIKKIKEGQGKGLGAYLRQLGAEPAYDGLELLIKDLSWEGKFVLQHHWRGNSVHGDFRVEETKDWLTGFTLLDSVEGVAAKHLKWKLVGGIKERTLFWEDKVFYKFEGEKLVKAPTKELEKEVFEAYKKLEAVDSLWKVDWDTGEEKVRTVDGKEKREKILCVSKTKEPFAWISVEGVTKPREIEPVPGGTRFYPGVFVIVDEGTYEKGAQKSYFREFFLHGKKLKGRLIFTLVAGLKEVKKAMNWLYWKPDDQEPYVLSKRAIRKAWLPKPGESALPKVIENQIPKEYKFWLKGLSNKERMEKRKAASEYLRSKKSTSEYGIKEKRKGSFILTRRHWKGQLVIRNIPVEDFHIKVDERQFHLNEDPLWEEEIAANMFTGEPEYFKPGTYGPLTKINPNRKISAFVEVLDKGDCEIIEEGPLFIRVIFKGKHLKEAWSFRRGSKQDKIWIFGKSAAPKTVEMSKSHIFKIKEYGLAGRFYSKDVKIPYYFEGIAFAAGTHNQTSYTDDDLKKAPSFVGIKIVVDHGSGVMDFVGKVVEQKWDSTISGIRIKGFTIDEDVARRIDLGLVDGLSPRVIGDWIDVDGIDVTQKILGWEHLAIVFKPACDICRIDTCNVAAPKKRKGVAE